MPKSDAVLQTYTVPRDRLFIVYSVSTGGALASNSPVEAPGALLYGRFQALDDRFTHSRNGKQMQCLLN